MSIVVPLILACVRMARRKRILRWLGLFVCCSLVLLLLMHIDTKDMLDRDIYYPNMPYDRYDSNLINSDELNAELASYAQANSALEENLTLPKPNATHLAQSSVFDTEANKITRMLPNFPFDYWEKNRELLYSTFEDNPTCGYLPYIHELKFSNTYWQIFRMTNATVYLYSSFYDLRKLNNLKRSIHILAMSETLNTESEVFCQVRYENQLSPVIVAASSIRLIWEDGWEQPNTGELAPYFITCELPDTDLEEAPSCVSLVENSCDLASNILKVIYEKPEEKKDFAVCVKGLDFYQDDISFRMVEWLEILALMGADKISFYQLQVHPNIERVLNYYESLGTIDVTHISLPAEQPNVPILQHAYLVNKPRQQSFNELIPYNDCFYRNMNSYKYILLLDLDEIIVPVQDNNWKSLMERVIHNAEPDVFASFNVRNVYFLDAMTPVGQNKDVPPYMHFLSHTHRSSLFSPPDRHVKSFLDTEAVLTVHKHMPIHFSVDRQLTYSIPDSDAQLNHYTEDCVSEMNCDVYRNYVTKDYGIYRHKDILVSKVKDVLSTLNFI